jgi:hypothetical protein
MRVLCRAYDLDDLGGSGVTLRTVVRYLRDRGDEVWATAQPHAIGEIRGWHPDLIVAQQWATGEASGWATSLRLPFVMFVHGPRQYEHFMPQCELVVFNTHLQRALAQPAIGRTPATVLHPPVFRNDYETPGDGQCLTWIGRGEGKGRDVALALAREFADEPFLFVTSDEATDWPANVEIVRPTDDMRSVYAQTRLLLMPSERESYGRVAVEAAMSGIPAVMSDLLDLREAISGLATFVSREASWGDAVRGALATIGERRTDAARLAALRDPEPELQALRDRFLAIAAAGRRRPTLSLCMTVANEAPTLEAAIRSVAAVVDEIVIGVDAKSQDETAAIAQRYATRTFVFDETSPPDFPRMRNRAMELVDTDWALVLDGHEWIQHADRIRGALETTAWSIEIETLYEPDERRIPGLIFPFPRIHRRIVRFGGAPAHEEVTTPADRRETRRDIKVWHERKPGHAADTRGAEKCGAELARLRDAWEIRGDRRALFYLANGLRDAGQFDEAAASYEEYLRAPNFADEAWQARLYLARCHVARRDLIAARKQFEEAILSGPERAEAMVGLAHALLEAGETRPAAAWFRLATAVPEPAHCRMFVETPVYRWGAWHGLALALDRQGDYAGAAEAEARALERGAGPWARDNVTWWRARAEECRG